jgi:hypothetical protein
MITGSKAAGIAVIVMIFLYSLAYYIGYNALTYTSLVELWRSMPGPRRSRGFSYLADPRASSRRTSIQSALTA